MQPSISVIADVNKELIDTYKAIQSDWKKVYLSLRKHAKLHSKEYYYHVRSSNPRTLHSRASKFIYLNRTCWNGLYRVNLKGQFNVPIGTKDSVILDTDNFELISEKLKYSKIICQDFKETIRQSEKGDFVYIDPPYTVKHNNNGFIKYNENIFSWDDQIRLRDSVLEGVEKGVMFTISNANHESILELYKDLGDILYVNRNSIISGKSKFRGKTSELLIRAGWL